MSSSVKQAPKFVFLEGGAATGKSSLCQHLLQQGYVVQFENFVELCSQNARYEPTGSVMSIKWISAMFTALEEYTEGPQRSKHNLVFFDRSFLTPWIYTRGRRNNLYVMDAMKEIQATFDCRLVLCEAASDVVRTRLRQRYDAGSVEEKKIREDLGEINDKYVTRIDARYEKLKAQGWFDFTIATDLPRIDDTVAQLLRRVNESKKRVATPTTPTND